MENWLQNIINLFVPQKGVECRACDLHFCLFVVCNEFEDLLTLSGTLFLALPCEFAPLLFYLIHFTNFSV